MKKKRSQASRKMVNAMMDQLEAMAVGRKIPTPEGEHKMSAVILQLAEPLLERHGDTPEQAQSIIMVTIAGWNKSMFPPDKQPLIEKDLIDAFVPKDGMAADMGTATDLLDVIVERRKKLFPDVRKIIVDYKMVIGDGGLTLNVTSAPIPDIGSRVSERRTLE
ncbi:MAG: hypothetical protein ACYC4N_31240 [Pirellulaceae bacterium]